MHRHPGAVFHRGGRARGAQPRGGAPPPRTVRALRPPAGAGAGRPPRAVAASLAVLLLLLAGWILIGCADPEESHAPLLRKALEDQGAAVGTISPAGPEGGGIAPSADNAAAAAPPVAPATPAPVAPAPVPPAPVSPASITPAAVPPAPATPAPESQAPAAQGPALPAPPSVTPAADNAEAGNGAHGETKGEKAPHATGARRKAGEEAAAKPRPAVPPPATPPPSAPPPGEPYWAKIREQLTFRVVFLGVTMGYAQFNVTGKTRYDGRDCYHLRVRFWTSDILSLVFPLNDLIDYYIDAKTLAPVRQDYFFLNNPEKDYVAVYDQGEGTLIRRNRLTGKVRKKYKGVPFFFDPVTLAYYVRAHDIEGEARAQNMFGGNKFLRIHTQTHRTERIGTGGGAVETLVVEPIIRREGKIEKKADLRMWMTNDVRRIPVRLYAKFVKIRTWTLVGELIPNERPPGDPRASQGRSGAVDGHSPPVARGRTGG